jgi:carboxylesterase
MSKVKLLEGAEPFYLSGDEVGCLVIHGFTATPQEVLWLGTYLNQQGYAVYGPRLAGHSTVPEDMARVCWHEWYADVLAGYAMLRTQCSKVFALGLSMGGDLALLLAAREPVDGVVAMSALHSLAIGWRRPLLWLYTLTGGMLGKHLPPPEQDPLIQAIIDEQHRRGEKPIGRACYSKRPARSVLQLDSLLKTMRGELLHVTAPVLLIHSLVDSLAPYEHMQRNFDQIGSQDKRMIVLENSDHVVTQDRARETVFSAAATFVASHR